MEASCGIGRWKWSDDLLAIDNTVHVACTLPQLRQVIGLIDAAVVAIAVSISNGFSVSHTALLTNAACECILSAEATDSFS